MKTLNVLKQAVLLATVATISVTAVNAQEKGDMAAGVNLAVGMGDNLTNFGIGAKFQYNITTPIRLEGAFTYFLPKTWGVSGLSEASLSMWDFSVNAHYLFPVGDKITVYPLAGVGILGVHTSYETNLSGLGGYYDASASSSEFNFNIGGGLDFKLSDKIILNAELKYKIGGTWSRFVISAGVAYRF
jgi:outer membrane protein X